MSEQKRLLLVSKFAFYPPHWNAFALICKRYGVRGSVIAAAPPELPKVHQQLGWVESEAASKEPFVDRIEHLPAGSRSSQRRWLAGVLNEIQADHVWLQQEPVEKLSMQVLAHYQNDPRPVIASAVCENLFRRRNVFKRYGRTRRWRRLDALLATATPSIEAIQNAGMPKRVPATPLVAGMEGPTSNPTALDLNELQIGIAPKPDDFVVGFAGRIVEQKGWGVLLEAVARLPETFKVAFAGCGDQSQQLKQRAMEAGLRGRVAVAGSLPKDQLWRFYRAVNCVAVPSMTRPKWKEQFGGVLADAMAVGVPLIGSDSGAIPEVIGSAGVIVPEGDVQSLSRAIKQLAESPETRRRLSVQGRLRYDSEFSMSAYADKVAQGVGLQHADAVSPDLDVGRRVA